MQERHREELGVRTTNRTLDVCHSGLSYSDVWAQKKLKINFRTGKNLTESLFAKYFQMISDQS